MSAPSRPIAVVLDGPPTPAWQERALAGLAESPALELADVRLVKARRRGRIRRAHAAVERHLFALGPDALAPVSIDRSDSGGQAGPAMSAQLTVWLSERPPRAEEPGDILCLRHGGRFEPAEEAFRRAALRGAPCVETEALLHRDGDYRVVARTISGARPFSTTLSRDRALWKLVALVRRAAERAPGLDLPASADASPSSAPTTAELILRSPSRWLRIVAARLLFGRPWRVRVRERGADPTSGWSREPPTVLWRQGHVYADPMLFEHQGGHHLFCEEILPGEPRGVISHTELHVDGTAASPPTPVLVAPHHLSYPFVFAHEGEIFLIPETSSVHRVELYRAVNFPHEWRHESILLDGLIASDATLLAHGDRLWLFVGVSVPHGTMLDELHLFSANDLHGPWQPHPQNPVVSDVRCARPAGAIQRWGSRLVRPGQDGSRRYGGAISFRQIDELSATDYSEHEIARLRPSDLGDARATHTYACDGRFEAIDLRQRVRRPLDELAQALRRRSPFSRNGR
jgi:hypothetical protein